MSGIFLGLDGGGTGCRALAADSFGNALGEGEAGPCNLAAVSEGDAFAAAHAALAAAINQAGCGPQDARGLCAGVAGWSHIPRREAFERRLSSWLSSAQISVVPDYRIAWAGATQNLPGIAVIAGTGSAAYGENAGSSLRTGGYGYLIDDRGSGYGTGRSMLAAILRAADGTGAATQLTDRALAHLQLHQPSELIGEVYGGRLDRTEIAALAPLVAEASSAGDAVAQRILMSAGGALAQLAEPIATALFPEPAAPLPHRDDWQSLESRIAHD